MQSGRNHVLVCYGNQLGYFHGAKYQILRGYHWLKNQHICVVTDRPEIFDGYPVNVLALDQKQVDIWSLKGQNHFGIKLLGLQLAIKSSPSHVNKSILLDTDMFWVRDPSQIDKLINDRSCALYQDEGHIKSSKNASIRRYEEGLGTNRFVSDLWQYELSAGSKMWGSAIIGIDHSNSHLLEKAFDLFKLLSPHVKAHTVEQFALAETLRLHEIKSIAAKHLVDHWSSIGKKNHATPILADFFATYGEHNFSAHLGYVNQIQIKRPISVLLKQKIDRWKNK
jgi:hypothetical protein